MGCGNSKSNSPPSPVNRQDTGIRRASKSSASSGSTISRNKQDHNKDKERKQSFDKDSEKETHIEGHDKNDNRTEADKEETVDTDSKPNENETAVDREGNENEAEASRNETHDDAHARDSDKDGKEELDSDEKTSLPDKEVDAGNESAVEEAPENEAEASRNETHDDAHARDSDEDGKKELDSYEKTSLPDKEVDAGNESAVEEAPENERNETDQPIDATDKEIIEGEIVEVTDDKEGVETIDDSNRELLPPTHVDTDIVPSEGKEDEKELTVDDGYDDVYTPFDEDEDEDKDDVDSDGYALDRSGIKIKSVDHRSNEADDEKDIRPSTKPGELYTDKEFPLDIAIVQGSSGVEWKRPKEFLTDPVLFSDGTSHYDIGQGSAGTCWFLSTVSVIADKKEMMERIVPETAYNIEDSENYDGIFHARFYRFGQWEDIYIDDYVPVIHEKVLWGARSSSDKNELWVSLLEKAFARLHGSYDAIYGGQPGDAYLQLTGGIGERLELNNPKNKPVALFKRIKNALSSGSQITCVVPDEYDEHQGLVGGHAYSLVGVAEVNNTRLVRVRNPWGHGEWKGPWSDKSSEWSSVTDDSVKPARKDDGEFYVSLDDFMKYFSETTICSLTPDFDCDGVSDSLNYVLSIYGDWTREMSGSFNDLLRNPRCCFTITEKGVGEDGRVPFVVQIIQHSAKRSVDHTSMRCDVFKIHTDKTTKKGRVCAVEIQGKKNNVYTTELQSSFRHKLRPGKYMIIPSTCDGGIEKAFLLRLFTPSAVKNVKKVPIETTILSCENEEELDHDGETHSLTFEKTLLGEFVTGVNAGGQVSNRDSYSSNPQYLITIPDIGADVPLVVHIMQKQEEPKYPVGFRLFPLDQGVNPPVDVNYLYNKYDNSPSHLEGSQSKFVISWDVDIRYMLPAGRYLGLVHLDHPNTEKAFCVLFKSTSTIGIKGYQAGE